MKPAVFLIVMSFLLLANPGLSPAQTKPSPTTQSHAELEEALKYCKDTIAQPPQDAETVQRHGRVLLNFKCYGDAVDLLQRALKIFPKDDALYRLLGKVQATQGKIDEAIDSYKTSIELNGKDANTHVELAKCYFAKKDNGHTHDELAIAAKLDPRNFDLFMFAGEMCAVSNDWDNALNYYRCAAYLHPEAAEPLSNVGFVLTKQSLLAWQRGQTKQAYDKIHEAQTKFQHAIDLKPDFESAKKNLSTAQMIEKQIFTRPPPTQPATQPSTTRPVDPGI